MAQKNNIIHNFSKKLLQKSIFPHLKEYLLWQAGKKESEIEKFAPISINLDLITACNFRCTHCIDKDIINTGKFLDFDYVKKLIGDWAKKGLKSVILIGGGEPTLYPKFEEVIQFLKGLSLDVGIVSNGIRTDKIENICHLFGKKDWVRLSLDCATDETYEKLHHPVVDMTLEKTLAQVKKMRQKNSEFQMGYSFLVIGDDKEVAGVPVVSNIKEISLAAKKAKENGFSYLSLKPFINPEGDRLTEITAKNLEEIKEEIKKAKEFEDENFKVIESVNLLCFYDNDLKKQFEKQPKTCHAQFFRSVVIPAGIGCCSLWRGYNNTKIIDTNKEITDDYYKELDKNRIKMINEFNAEKTCGQTLCLYAPLNWWIEELIQHPEKIEGLEQIDDFGDYFF
ncbi:MAG: radical SAM protein [Candidatus Pacebacteria bacterium]|nr:radical SAM protein [Candidatus Paceibacterota bacterium]